MLFRAYQPGRPLSEFIEHFWLYRGYSSPHAHERIFPTGCFELVFNLRNDELRIYEEANSARWCSRYSGAVVSGPYEWYFVTDRSEEFSVIGVHFRPGGAFPFLGLPAYEFADAHIDVANIWGPQASEVRQRLASLPSPARQFQYLETALQSRLRHPWEHHPAVSLALDSFRSNNSRAIVRNLARQSGLSDRRFIDIFRFEVGLNPKLFNRIDRFQKLLARVHLLPDPAWDQLAQEHGYFDQSHLIRNFLDFSGFSPTDYFRRLKDLRVGRVHVKSNHFPVAKPAIFSNTADGAPR